MDKVHPDLRLYIENHVFPSLIKNDEAHQIGHIQNVIDRSFQLSKDLDVNPDMVYAIAAYHDSGHYIDKDRHEILSAEIMANDTNLLNFFSSEEIAVMKAAIEDHRASAEHEPRNIYGQIVSSADRNTDINEVLHRTYNYGLKHFPNYSTDQQIDRAYDHLKEKFGPTGYAKSYIKDDAYEQYLKDFRKLLSDKAAFTTKLKSVNNLP